MFTNLRQSAQSVFAKLILFFLVGLFGLWGIGDVFRNMGGNTSVVATVGKTTISRQELAMLAHQNHSDPRQALIGLVNSALVDLEAKAVGVVVSDDTVADFLRNAPELKGKDGKFDKNLYRAAVNGSGRSEAGFVDDLRLEIAAKLLMGSLNSVQVPEEIVKLAYKAEHEQRSAALTIIPASVSKDRLPSPPMTK